MDYLNAFRFQKLNNYIKEVCEVSGINEVVEGFKFDKKRNRKIKGFFPKCQLITTHVFRRTFATNLYGELPTPLIMQITAHSTEKMLLQYIGKGSYDYAQQIADYFDKRRSKKLRKPNLSIVKKSNES